MSQQRIQKLIAAAGVASRRQAEVLIRQGRVTVNGKTVTLGDKGGVDDEIRIDDKLLKTGARTIRMLLLNKPEGYLTTREDPGSRKTVFSLLPEPEQGRWINVGRLDLNTGGLLLFTTDGELANRLMHPSGQIEREYLCRVYGEINNKKINRLKHGINLKDKKIDAAFKSIECTRSHSKNHWFKVVITEGRNREVRRLWEAVDCQVSRLTRIRYGNVVLPESLASGKYKELTKRQIESLSGLIAPGPGITKT